jgi:hypothetical protein
MIRWRTVIAVCFLALVMLAALHMCSLMPIELATKVFADLVYGLVGLSLVLGGKSSIEHLAGGGGIKGAWSVLTTSEKPISNDSVQKVAP